MTKLTSLLKTLIGRFLPLSGGTMTGIIKLANGDALTNETTEVIFTNNTSVETKGLDISFGQWNEKGAAFALKRKEAYLEPGHFVLSASDGENFTEFRGKPEGDLYWRDRSIPYVPHNRSTRLTLPQSGGSLIMPCNGFLVAVINPINASNYLFLELINVTAGISTSTTKPPLSEGWNRAFLPVSKGDNVEFYYANVNVVSLYVVN